VTVEKIVPPQVFCPPPEVDSALVSFKLRPERVLTTDQEKVFTTVVRELFNQRRKQIGKLLGQMTGSKETAAKILDECGFAPDLRPDKLSVADFVKLTEKLTSFKG
jgi:16S rRNA (adenine1518-N6/adenine1519-N6)-dimethyltransferase